MPVAYHDFVSAYWNGSQLAGFFSAILERPNIAALVERIYLISDDFQEGGSLHIQGQLIRDSLALPKGWEQSFHMGHKDESVDDCTIHTAWSPLSVDLLLSKLVNIRQLHLNMRIYSPYGELLPRSPTLLSSLKAIRLETDRLEGFDLDKCAGLISKTSNLESLHLGMCTSITQHLNLGTLRWLKVENCTLELESVQTLAESCPILETFISHNVGYVSGCFIGSGAPRAFAEGLLPCKGTLRHFEMQLSDRLASQLMSEDIIVSLKEFESLKTLILTGDCMGFKGFADASPWELSENPRQSEATVSFLDFLPPSIEILIIEGNFVEIFKPLLELASEVRNRKFPFLKTVKETGFDWKFPPHAVRPVKDAMRASGVAFEISEESAFCLQK